MWPPHGLPTTLELRNLAHIPWQLWGLYDCYGVYVVLTLRLACISRNSHPHTCIMSSGVHLTPGVNTYSKRSPRAQKGYFCQRSAGVCSITAGSAAFFRGRPTFSGHRKLLPNERCRRAHKQVDRGSLHHWQTFNRYSGGNQTILDYFDFIPTLLEQPRPVSCLICTKSWVLRACFVLKFISSSLFVLQTRCRAAVWRLLRAPAGLSCQLKTLALTPWQLRGLHGN